jgi:hypothetical protein
MQFSDTTNDTGMVQEITFLTSADTTSYPLKDRARDLNAEYRYYENLIASIDRLWRNNVTIDSIALSSGTGTYALTSLYRDVIRVDLVDDNSDDHTLQRIDLMELGTPVNDFMETDGTPQFYSLSEDDITLHPAPDATMTLKVHVKGNTTAFTATGNDTREPSFHEDFHILLPWKASLKYNTLYHPDRVGNLDAMIKEKEARLKEHYRSRARSRPQLRACSINAE